MRNKLFVIGLVVYMIASSIFLNNMDAIKIQCLAGDKLLKVMELYKSVAEKYNTKWSRAERCIRHSLQSALSEKPVNSEFIRSAADDIRLNYREK